MEQNSPSIARRHAPFARAVQAFPIPWTSKTRSYCTYDWDPSCRCNIQLSSANGLARRAHENPTGQNPPAHGKNRLRPARFFNIHCPRFRRSSPPQPSQLMKNLAKYRPNAPDSHGKAALVQCLLPHPRLRNGPSALNLPRIRQRVVFLLRRQDATTPFLGSGLLTRR